MNCLIGIVILASPAVQQAPPEIRASVQDPKVQSAVEFVDTRADAAAYFLREIGAIISPAQLEKINGYIDDGRREAPLYAVAGVPLRRPTSPGETSFNRRCLMGFAVICGLPGRKSLVRC